MKKLSDFFYSNTSLASSIVAMVVMVLYASLVLGGKSSCFESQLEEGMKVFGLKFGLSYDYAVGLFNSLDRDGLLCYRKLILIWDNIFPLLYSSMYILWISLILRKLTNISPMMRYLNLFPLVPAFMDWVENIFEVRLVNYYLEFSDLQVQDVAVSSLISQIKWVCSYSNYAVITISLCIFIYHLSVNRKQHLKN